MKGVSPPAPNLFGERLTESDIRVFVTLARFDAAYHVQFKCNLRRIADYPNLSAYLARLFGLPAFRDTFRLDHIKHGYYSIKSLNPSRIVPLGPELRWAEAVRFLYAALDDKSQLDENYEVYSPRTNCISPTSISPYIDPYIDMQIYR